MESSCYVVSGIYGDGADHRLVSFVCGLPAFEGKDLTCSALAIGEVLGDPQGDLATLLNELHTLGPALDNAVQRE